MDRYQCEVYSCCCHQVNKIHQILNIWSPPLSFSPPRPLTPRTSPSSVPLSVHSLCGLNPHDLRIGSQPLLFIPLSPRTNRAASIFHELFHYQVMKRRTNSLSETCSFLHLPIRFQNFSQVGIKTTCLWVSAAILAVVLASCWTRPRGTFSMLSPLLIFIYCFIIVPE